MVGLVCGKAGHVALKLCLEVEVSVTVVIGAEHAAHGFAQVVGVGLIDIRVYVPGIAFHHITDHLLIQFPFGEVVECGEGEQRIKGLGSAAVEIEVVELCQGVSDGQVAACPQKKKFFRRLSRLLDPRRGLPVSSSFNGFCNDVSKGVKLCAMRSSSFSSS